MPTFSLLSSPASLTANLHSTKNVLLPITALRCNPAASVLDFSPVYFRRGDPRPVSNYALFKGWLLLSQPPGCLGAPTSFNT